MDKFKLLVVAACIISGSAGFSEAENHSNQGAHQVKPSQIRFTLTSIFVQNQGEALKFYTETLGLKKKQDIPLGEFRFLTVVSAVGPGEVELLLEPNDHPAAKAFQEAIYKDGIPANTFAVKDVQDEYERLKELGVVFKMPPTQAGPTTLAVFDDTCGNLIQIHQD